MRIVRSLYVQVLVAVVIGALLGRFDPGLAVACKPLGDAFIKLVKMLIAPIVFGTVVHGIAKVGDLGKVGRVGWKALLYFEALTTLALLIGLFVGTVIAPGVGVNADLSKVDPKDLAEYVTAGQKLGGVDFVLHVIPTTIVDAFAQGDMLQVLLVALLFGAALSRLGARGKPLTDVIEGLTQTLFGVVGLVMRVAPIGAFGAMASTVGKFAVGAPEHFAGLRLASYVTRPLCVLGVLGGVSALCGVNIFRLVSYLREGLLLVLGTSSSESALPSLMRRLEAAGCSESVTGLVVPMGYSFNLDGTSIYLTLATLFVAQATNTHLAPLELAEILGVLLLTSKGAATVTGGGFITLAATLSATGHIPIAGLGLLLGIDRFMSEGRAIVNLLGNAVATIVISRWEGELDDDKLREALTPGERVPVAPV